MTKRRATQERDRKLVQRPGRGPAPSVLRLANHFAELQPEFGEHPVDLAVDRIPAVAARRRKLLRMSAEIGEQIPDRGQFLAYEDGRLEQTVQRQEIFFDLGWAHGEIAGRSESTAAKMTATPAARAFGQKILAAVVASGLSEQGATALLLELARGIVLGTRPPRLGGGRKRRRIDRPGAVRRTSSRGTLLPRMPHVS